MTQKGIAIFEADRILRNLATTLPFVFSRDFSLPSVVLLFSRPQAAVVPECHSPSDICASEELNLPIGSRPVFSLAGSGS